MMIVKCINASIQALRITFSIMLQEFMSSDINLCDLKHNRLNNLGDSWTQRCHERGHYKLPVNTRREAVVTIWFLSRLIIEDEAKSFLYFLISQWPWTFTSVEFVATQFVPFIPLKHLSDSLHSPLSRSAASSCANNEPGGHTVSSCWWLTWHHHLVVIQEKQVLVLQALTDKYGKKLAVWVF